MSASSRPPPTVLHAAELWLARAGDAHELAERLRDLAELALGRVVCAGGGAEERWAAALAAPRGLALEREPALAVATGATAGAALEARLVPGAAVLAVLAPPVLAAVLAHALGLAPEGAAALRVEAGRLAHLVRTPAGFTLRRSNVRAPERRSGSPLPNVAAPTDPTPR
jgi:hypothetical protein